MEAIFSHLDTYLGWDRYSYALLFGEDSDVDEGVLTLQGVAGVCIER